MYVLKQRTFQGKYFDAGLIKIGRRIRKLQKFEYGQTFSMGVAISKAKCDVTRPN